MNILKDKSLFYVINNSPTSYSKEVLAEAVNGK